MELYQQTNARLWRQGQKSETVIIQHIITRGTVDEKILKALTEKDKTQTALMTAVTCILAPMSLPIGPVPISFTNLAIYLSLYLLGWKKGTISYLIYLLLGLVGLPVFSGFTGGPAKLAGPTGGYIIGFIVMAVIAGLVIDNCHKPLIQLVGMIAGTIVCYLFGTVWFCIVADSTFKAALGICVIPFIPADLIKMIIAMIIGPMIKKRIR